VGAAALEVAQGSVFTDPGATAVDAAGTDLASQINVSGAVDTATPGLYTLTYSVLDSAGASATVSRVVTVIAALAAPATASSTPPTP